MFKRFWCWAANMTDQDYLKVVPCTLNGDGTCSQLTLTYGCCPPAQLLEIARLFKNEGISITGERLHRLGKESVVRITTSRPLSFELLWRIAKIAQNGNGNGTPHP